MPRRSSTNGCDLVSPHACCFVSWLLLCTHRKRPCLLLVAMLLGCHALPLHSRQPNGPALVAVANATASQLPLPPKPGWPVSAVLWVLRHAMGHLRQPWDPRDRARQEPPVGARCPVTLVDGMTSGYDDDYDYMYVCVCVCVCMYVFCNSSFTRVFLPFIPQHRGESSLLCLFGIPNHLEVLDEKTLGLGQRTPPHPPPHNLDSGCTPLRVTHWLAAAPCPRVLRRASRGAWVWSCCWAAAAASCGGAWGRKVTLWINPPIAPRFRHWFLAMAHGIDPKFAGQGTTTNIFWCVLLFTWSVVLALI